MNEANEEIDQGEAALERTGQGRGGQTAQTGIAKNDRVFIGHPAGLGWLSASEFWERFAYYGMQALLVLYLTHFLFQPGVIDNVWGIEPFRHALEFVYRTKLDYAALA